MVPLPGRVSVTGTSPSSTFPVGIYAQTCADVEQWLPFVWSAIDSLCRFCVAPILFLSELVCPSCQSLVMDVQRV